jgi:AcrR family transcriptional regulator
MEPDVKPQRGRPSQGAREALLEAARELFAERGYEDVSTSEILARSGVSKGAMYHHFPSKLELFEAVYIGLEDDLIQRLGQDLQPGTPLQQLRAGGRAYLRESARGGPWAEINLKQARQVLGVERWRRLASERGLAVIEWQLAAAIEAGELPAMDAGDAAAIYVAAMIEAGLLVTAAADQGATERSAAAILDRLLTGLGSGRA